MVNLHNHCFLVILCFPFLLLLALVSWTSLYHLILVSSSLTLFLLKMVYFLRASLSYNQHIINCTDSSIQFDEFWHTNIHSWKHHHIKNIFITPKEFLMSLCNLVPRACSVAKSCPTLCDPIEGSLPGSSVHGIFQARILEWVVTSFSRGSSQPRDRTCVPALTGRFFTTEPPGKSSLVFPPPKPLCLGNYWSACCHHKLVEFSRILYKWNHTGCILVCLFFSKKTLTLTPLWTF